MFHHVTTTRNRATLWTNSGFGGTTSRQRLRIKFARPLRRARLRRQLSMSSPGILLFMTLRCTLFDNMQCLQNATPAVHGNSQRLAGMEYVPRINAAKVRSHKQARTLQNSCSCITSAQKTTRHLACVMFRRSQDNHLKQVVRSRVMLRQGGGR